MSVKQIFILMLFVTAGPVFAAPTATDRVLVIDASSMPVGAGKATLTIGTLHRANGVYTGDYKIKVFPWFLKNEKGTLAIVVSDKSLADVNQGKAAAIVGTATTSGKGGTTRNVKATATPINSNHGTIKLWFTAGTRKMIFEPAYHFAGTDATLVLAPEVGTKL